MNRTEQKSHTCQGCWFQSRAIDPRRLLAAFHQQPDWHGRYLIRRTYSCQQKRRFCREIL